MPISIEPATRPSRALWRRTAPAEVLPEAEYSEEHLPGAVSLPLRHLTSETIASLEFTPARRRLLLGRPLRPELAGPSAARAAGLRSRADDYTAGKADWLATGLPTEGSGPPAPPSAQSWSLTFRPASWANRPGGQYPAAEDSGWDLCVVTNDRRIVAGRLRTSAVGPDDARPAEQVMEAGHRRACGPTKTWPRRSSA